MRFDVGREGGIGPELGSSKSSHLGVAWGGSESVEGHRVSWFCHNMVTLGF